MVLKLTRPKQKSPLTLLRQIIYLLPVVSVGGWWSYNEIQSYLVKPEAIVVLGGHEERERYAAHLASKNPTLPIWVSSGSPSNYVKRIFAKAGVNSTRLHLDYKAKDTVTNFTTLVDQLKAQGIDSVYLITSENHMRRAWIVGEIVFGSRGIVIKPLAVPSHARPESFKNVYAMEPEPCYG